jgi:dTDP-glucose 4,6-dehydratase
VKGKQHRVIVTGGAGFIGSALCRHLVMDNGAEVLNVDKLTYASNLLSLAPLESNARYKFVRADVADHAQMAQLVREFQPDSVVHLAAETHVDRSIDDAAPFVQTNIVGTYVLLDVALSYWSALSEEARQRFRFLTVSTDEVYGSLEKDDQPFAETTPYQPNSPYAASKASADFLSRAWNSTYGLPLIISNCSNNFGPYQFPEKLIPLTIINALQGRSIPVYGHGANIRDWLYVEDHARALAAILKNGRPGDKYNVGARNERTNLQVVEQICKIMDGLKPASAPHRSLLQFVEDRPGHDFRYAINSDKIEKELNWSPMSSFEQSLQGTVRWYCENTSWWSAVQGKVYAGERLGLRRRSDINK